MPKSIAYLSTSTICGTNINIVLTIEYRLSDYSSVTVALASLKAAFGNFTASLRSEIDDKFITELQQSNKIDDVSGFDLKLEIEENF